MATEIIRPDGTTSQFGFTPLSNVHTVLKDQTDATFAQQVQSSAGFIVTFANPTSLSGATVNSWTISIRASQDRRPNPQGLFRVGDGTAAYAGITMPPTGVYAASPTTYTSAAVTKKQDGVSNLDASYFDNFDVRYDANTDGQKVYEIFLTIDYTPGGYGHQILDVGSANIDRVINVTSANIDSIIDV
jgi:hypothetical protein